MIPLAMSTRVVVKGKEHLLCISNPGMQILRNFWILRRIMDADGKGRHTTAASSLFELSNGTRVIDTPGIREFGLWRMTPAELRVAFPDVAEHAVRCRFRDCSHVHEPVCAVRATAEDGSLAPARYRSYRRILATLAR